MGQRIGLLALALFAAAVLPATSSAGEPAGGEVPVSGDGEFARIAWAGDRYIVVYLREEFDATTEDGIFKREFSATGAPLGSEQLVSGANTGRRAAPDIAAAPDGRHVIVWQDDREETSPGDTDSDDDVMMRRYAQGQAGPIEQVSFAPGEILTEYEETTPAVALTPAGSPVVAWWEGDAENHIVVRNLAPEGAPNADQPLAITGFDEPDLVAQPGGPFVLAWYDGANGGYAMRRFSAGGSPVSGVLGPLGGDDLRLSSNSTGTVVAAWNAAQNPWRRFTPELIATGLPAAFPNFGGDDPSIGLAEDGSVVIVYQRLDAEQTDSDVAFTRYGPDNTVVSPDTPANDPDEFDQFDSDVAVQPGGSFAVVWSTGSPSGPQLRARFYTNPAAQPAPTSPGTDPVVPSNRFSLVGKPKLKRGRTLLRVRVPGPGVLALRQAAARGAAAAKKRRPLIRSLRKRVTKAGLVTLVIRPSKAGRKRLATKGRFEVRIAITYTPTGGQPRRVTRSLKLSAGRRR